MVIYQVNACASRKNNISSYNYYVLQLQKMFLTLILAWISNYIHYNMWNEITFAFNGGTIEIWEWISDYIPHFYKYVVTYPCLD